MKNTNKGFTLIELLAVIVVLAVIALIATPIILGVIDTAKKGAAKSSALGYIDAVEKQIAINQLDKSKEDIKDGVYDVPMAGVTIKGKGPESGWILIEKGQVTNYSMKLDSFVVTKDADVVNGNTVATKPEGGSNSSTYYAFGEPTNETDYNNVKYPNNNKALIFVRKQEDTLGVCLIKDGLNCFNINDYTNESTHLKNVLGESSCSTTDSMTYCDIDTMNCGMSPNGTITCVDDTAGYRCKITNAGVITCS